MELRVLLILILFASAPSLLSLVFMRVSYFMIGYKTERWALIFTAAGLSKHTSALPLFSITISIFGSV